jgi:hypothetical protein
MSRIALVRLGPTVSFELIDSNQTKRTLYDSTGIRPVPGKVAPVVIDHDMDRRVGEVLELVTMDDVEPWPVCARWLCARVRLSDDAPAWLKRGTPASISYYTMFESEINGWPIIREGLLNEVTLCSATHKPVEPLAKVILLRDEPAAEVIHHQPQLLRRTFATKITVR